MKKIKMIRYIIDHEEHPLQWNAHYEVKGRNLSVPGTGDEVSFHYHDSSQSADFTCAVSRTSWTFPDRVTVYLKPRNLYKAHEAFQCLGRQDGWGVVEHIVDKVEGATDA